MVGLFSGAVVYGLVYERMVPALTKWGRLGAVTFADALRVEPWLVILVFAEIVAVGFYVLEQHGKVSQPRRHAAVGSR
jgi:hypothetical protein